MFQSWKTSREALLTFAELVLCLYDICLLMLHVNPFIIYFILGILNCRHTTLLFQDKQSQIEITLIVYSSKGSTLN